MAEPILLAGDKALPNDVSGTAITVGTFDGVHRGHQDVIARLAARARDRSLESALLTFEPHPLHLLRPESAPQLLTPGREKLDVLTSTGVDLIITLPFTRDIANLDAERFVIEILRDRFRMRELLIGHDHGFGRGRAGGVDVLQRLGSELNFPVTVVDPIRDAVGDVISSSSIRRAISSGRLDAASDALGRAYSVVGTVERGEARGRRLGFPTLNLGGIPAVKLLPPEGVYAVRVAYGGTVHGGMLSTGPRPAFGDMRPTFEVHLFDVGGDWYGREVRVDLVARLRDILPFSSADALVARMRDDEREARAALTVTT